MFVYMQILSRANASIDYNYKVYLKHKFCHD